MNEEQKRLLNELEQALQQNENYLKQISRFHSLYQWERYQKFYHLIEDIRNQEYPEYRVLDISQS